VTLSDGLFANEGTIVHRAGKRRVHETIEWRRRIGGRLGPNVLLPAGTYSDDTQLRLAVSRSIRGSGDFDVEAFAKVELPVWLSYSLGAGRGTTTAAANLTKPSVAWFSNFFSTREGRGYFDAGGNGAAMRIQPHIWKSSSLRYDEFACEVLKDAITTHGHPVGFCGAIFHGLSLAHALVTKEFPAYDDWRKFLSELQRLPQLVQEDDQLKLFWLGAWEERFGHSLEQAVAQETRRTFDLISDAKNSLQASSVGYERLLKGIGGFNEATRGSGMNTAVAAVALASFGRQMPAEDVITLGANAIGSDTDTIASMAGAILGAVQGGEPKWKIQDRDYLISEAARISDIALGKGGPSFPYSDLMEWSPPVTQGDAVGSLQGSLWLAGLGKAQELGEVWSSSDADWQWLRLDFGQTVHAKRRANPRELSRTDLPLTQPRSITSDRRQLEPSLFTLQNGDAQPQAKSKNKARARESVSDIARSTDPRESGSSVDELTDWIIHENFRPEIIGRAFLATSQGANGIERSIALAAVVAKALEARRKRSNK
jgi:ADP-ribosylglycohydrolase